MGAVDGDAGAGEAEEGRLLGVGAGEGLEGAEDDGVCGLLANGLLEDRIG